MWIYHDPGKGALGATELNALTVKVLGSGFFLHFNRGGEPGGFLHVLRRGKELNPRYIRPNP